MIIQFIPWSHVSAPAAKCIDTIVYRYDRIPDVSTYLRPRSFLLQINLLQGRILYASILLGIAGPIKNPTRLSWIHFASNHRLTKIHENRSICVPPAHQVFRVRYVPLSGFYSQYTCNQVLLISELISQLKIHYFYVFSLSYKMQFLTFLMIRDLYIYIYISIIIFILFLKS